MVLPSHDDQVQFEITAEEIHTIQELMTNLLFKIHEDGIVDNDEAQLLVNIKSNLKEYERILNKAAEDGVIDKGELAVLEEFRKQIVESAYKIAQQDQMITNEEKALIMMLVRKLIRDHDDSSLRRTTNQ